MRGFNRHVFDSTAFSGRGPGDGRPGSGRAGFGDRDPDPCRQSGACGTEADLLGISFAFGFITTALVYAIGKVSGCHINPAVTFALAVTRRFPWREVPVYWIAQYVGAVIGAFGIWGVFGANAVTFGMGQTHFAADASTSYYLQAALAEAAGTGLLLFAILGIVDGRSPQQLAGLVIGGAVVGIILIFVPVTGASLNPA